MAKLSYFLVAILSFVALNAQAQSVEDARLRARKLTLNAYILASGEASKSILATIFAKLKNPIRVPPEGSEFQVCLNNQDIMAYTAPDSLNGIYVCSSSLKMKTIELAQVLIHEAIHLSGVDSECTTTSLEFAIMKRARLRPMRNGYYLSCGIER